MNEKTRATTREATTAGLENAFLAARTETYAAPSASLQDLYLSRFGLPPATAAAVRELAFPSVDSWRAAR
jgi:hypothetical protein